MISGMATTKPRVLKVSGKKTKEYTKKVSGALGWQLRENGFCRMDAGSPTAVYNAVKAVSTCNAMVEKAGVVLCADLSLRDIEANGTTIRGMEMMVREVFEERPGNFIEFRVSSSSDEMHVARAIVAKTDAGNGVDIKCAGETAVNKCVNSVIMANHILKESGKKMVFVPKWGTASTNDGSGEISIITVEAWRMECNTLTV